MAVKMCALGFVIITISLSAMSSIGEEGEGDTRNAKREYESRQTRCSRIREASLIKWKKRREN